MKNLKTFLDRFKSRVEGLKATDNASQDQDEVEEIEQLLKNIEDQIEDIDTEMEDDEELSSQKPLIDKLSEHKNDFNILKNKFNQKKDEIKSSHAKELLFTGQLKGIDKRKAERDVAADQVKEVDEQGQMLDSIHENVKGANVNLENMNVEAKKQGEQIDRIGDKVITMDNTVKKTGNVMTDIERRICCRKCIIVSGIILIFLGNIIMGFLILARMFGWPGFGKDKPKNDEGKGGGNNNPKYTKGVSVDYTHDIDFTKFKENSIDFVMLLAGTGQVTNTKVIEKFTQAKTNNVKIGMFWDIDANDFNEAGIQVMNATKFVQDEIKNKNRDLNYDFYFKIKQKEEAFKKTEKINEMCKDFTLDCGIVLSYSDFNQYFKSKLDSLGNIKKYWIETYDKNLDLKVSNKIALWSTEESKNLGYNYNVINSTVLKQ